MDCNFVHEESDAENNEDETEHENEVPEVVTEIVESDAICV